MFLCGVMVRLWVVGFECDFGVVVRVRFITSFDVSNRLKMANRCGTCGKRSATLQETVRHHWQNHNEAALCVVRPIWDAEKGAHVYQRLNYKVTPETIPDASTLHVDDINWTITPPLPSGIGPTPQQRQPKLSDTLVRCTTAQQVSFDVQEQLNQTIGYEQDEQTDLLCDSFLGWYVTGEPPSCSGTDHHFPWCCQKFGCFWETPWLG